MAILGFGGERTILPAAKEIRSGSAVRLPTLKPGKTDEQAGIFANGR